jgi:hypothetical protein
LKSHLNPKINSIIGQADINTAKMKAEVKIIFKVLKHFFFLLIFLISFKGSAQQRKDGLSNDSSNRISYLSDTVWHDWRKIDSIWMTTEYHAILDKFKLKMNCMHCSRILMNVEMTIDSLGKLTGYNIISSYKCGEAFDSKLADAFMQYFYNITFPAVFYHKKLTAMLGTGLKC